MWQHYYYCVITMNNKSVVEKLETQLYSAILTPTEQGTVAFSVKRPVEP